MQRTVDESLTDVDAVLFVLAADEAIGGGDRFIAGRVYGGDAPVVVALNKVDRLNPEQIAAAIARAAQLGDFHALHPVSGRTGDGVEPLRDELVALLPEGPAYYPEGELTDQSVEERIAEFVREQALHLTREEVPHAITVEVQEIDEGRVSATVFVETESQKGIVVGKGGRMIREIGSRARPEIEQLLGRPVFLELMVKVRPRWRRDEAMLARLGI
jgi:GTP-binding protein Era